MCVSCIQDVATVVGVIPVTLALFAILAPLSSTVTNGGVYVLGGGLQVSQQQLKSSAVTPYTGFTMWNPWRPCKSSFNQALASKDCTFRCGSIASKSSKLFSLYPE
jgi:hypothetical protein